MWADIHIPDSLAYEGNFEHKKCNRIDKVRKYRHLPGLEVLTHKFYVLFNSKLTTFNDDSITSTPFKNQVNFAFEFAIVSCVVVEVFQRSFIVEVALTASDRILSQLLSKGNDFWFQYKCC
jgi:hypothetical protein